MKPEAPKFDISRGLLRSLMDWSFTLELPVSSHKLYREPRKAILEKHTLPVEDFSVEI